MDEQQQRDLLVKLINLINLINLIYSKNIKITIDILYFLYFPEKLIKQFYHIFDK